MDRHLLASSKSLQIPNEQPGTSRQVYNYNKFNGRVNNFNKNNFNKNNPKNGSNNQNNRINSRNREIRTSKDYLTPKLTLNSELLSYVPAKRHNPKHGFVKERFVQANCQFVVKGNQDLIEHLKDPDLFVDWDAIEEVIYSFKNDDFCCPICLYPPTAAKITKCGHIYCWSCALHYLSLSDKKSRPCPICFHNIYKQELKSLTLLKKHNFMAGDIITFNLMKIRKGSTLAVPITYQENFEHSLNAKNIDPILDGYHKIFISSIQQRSNLIQREFDELQRELDECKKDKMPEICFVEAALENLTERKSLLEETILDDALVYLKPLENADLNDYTYFYQSEDGQHIYLHSINIRMLKHEYQELRFCPVSIKGKVVEVHRQTVTEDIRKRFAHLRHLPLSCEYMIVELKFDESVVQQATLDEFASEIGKREKERRRRETAQNIRDRNIEIENNKKLYNIHPLSDFSISEEDFPAYHLGNEEEFGSLSTTPPQMQQSSTPESSSPGSNNGTFHSSFANMLATGKTHFDVRKKVFPTQIKSVNEDSEEEGDQPPMGPCTLSDYFDQCLKVTKNRKEKRNRKK